MPSIFRCLLAHFRCDILKVVTPTLNEITSQHEKLWWLEKLEGEMVGCAPILHLDEVFADPQVQFLGMETYQTSGQFM